MEWKDPPGASWGLTEEAAALRRRPGQWAVVIVHPNREKARRQRERIVNGSAVPFRPQGSFETTLRDCEDGTVELYARYIGEEGEYGEPAEGAVHWTGTGPGSGPEDLAADVGADVELPGAVAPDRDGDR